MFHTGLGRDGPGLLLRDIRRGAQDVVIAVDTLVALSPDVVLLLDMDHDRDLLALNAFNALLAERGLVLPHLHAPRPNTGMATGLDLDGDGQRGEGDDAQGWARFAGGGGMALMSRYPIAEARDFSTFLWRDLPGARLPLVEGAPYPSDAVFEVQRLSSTGHWQVRLALPQGPLSLWLWHAGPPVFGGPHQRNYHRNADETRFWLWQLESTEPNEPLVLMGNANLDPVAGDGDHAVIAALLAHPRLQDPAPEAPLPGSDTPVTATGHWPEGPGALRVDYLLPSQGLVVTDAGLVWPSAGAVHAVTWADIALPE